MSDVRRGLDILTEEDRSKAVKDIVDFFATERNEEIGVIAAGEMLDFFLQSIGPHIFNKGVEDAQEMVKRRTEELVADLEDVKNI